MTPLPGSRASRRHIARPVLAGLLVVACAGCTSSSAASPVPVAPRPAEVVGAAPADPVPAAVSSKAGRPDAGSPGVGTGGDARAADAADRSAAADGALLGSQPATLDALRTDLARRPVAVLLPGQRRPAPVEVRTTDPVSGGLDLPANAATVAWWGSGTAPGEPTGSVVLAAHVSYQGQTGPFTRLAQVDRGARVEVTSESGERHRYVVESVRSAPKTALDREALFRTSGRPALVLVTCGGEFDERTRSYEDNVVVTARPAR